MSSHSNTVAWRFPWTDVPGRPWFMGSQSWAQLKQLSTHEQNRASQVALVVKNLLARAGDVRDVGLIPGLGRSPGVGNGNPLQYSCLGNPTDRGAWQATQPIGSQKSRTQLSDLALH